MIDAKSEDPLISKAIYQLIFPFSLERHSQHQLRDKLLEEGYEAFELGNLEMENKFYGPDHRVSHRNMERYYLPFTNHVLYPNHNDPEAFRRLSNVVNVKATLHTRQLHLDFTVHSVDVILCPFDTGFLTLRVELDSNQDMTFGQAIEFGDRFRHLQDSNKLDLQTFITFGDKNYDEVEDFIFQELSPRLLEYLDRSTMKGTYFEKLPFFMDERMFVIGFCAFSEESEITLTHRYRAGRLDGLNLQGDARISATHLPYMERYSERFEYDRWAPNTYYITDETCFICLTKETSDNSTRLANQMYGEYYYGLLLNLFHRIVLLKLSISYSQVQLERKQEHTEELIRDITAFSAKYYFVEIVSQTQGREIFHRLRYVYGNDEMFEDVKMTLNDLYKYQETQSSKQSRYLLTILTIYTVISGIYGMNQVIEDLKGNFTWSFLSDYSSFQWIAFVVTFSGLAVAFLLVINVLWNWGRDFVRRQWGKR